MTRLEFRRGAMPILIWRPDMAIVSMQQPLPRLKSKAEVQEFADKVNAFESIVLQASIEHKVCLV